MITDDQHELLKDIITNTERTDKLSVRLDPVSRTMTIEYDDLDDEWFKEMQALVPVAVAQQAWDPHPLDNWGQMFLLEIASSANPPDTQPGDSPDWCGDVTLSARDGWQVCFFYDCGELDYIDHFITPTGERLDVWPDGYQGDQWPPVMCWRGVSDTERFRPVSIPP